MRMREGITLALLIICTTGCGERVALSPLQSGDVVMAFGDSLTHGTGVQPEFSYPSVLGERLGIDVVNAGVPGELSAEGLARLPTALKSHNPALVVLVHGGNDIMRRQSSQALEDSLRKMVRLSREAGAEVVMLGVPGFNLSFSPPEAYERVAFELNVPIDTSILPVLMRNPKMKSDRVHFNQTGYARMAVAIHQLLAATGAV